jgi:hypothetical protein
MNEKPWVKNAPNLLIVNTIFAALAGILLVLVFQVPELNCHWLWPLLLLLLAFLFFAWSAEEITTAIDEKDVYKYVYILIFYNLGVITLFGGLASIIHYKYQVNGWLVLVITIILLYRPWLRDICFLIFRQQKFLVYLEELLGNQGPDKDHSILMRFFYWTKKFKL